MAKLGVIHPGEILFEEFMKLTSKFPDSEAGDDDVSRTDSSAAL